MLPSNKLRGIINQKSLISIKKKHSLKKYLSDLYRKWINFTKYKSFVSQKSMLAENKEQPYDRLNFIAIKMCKALSATAATATDSTRTCVQSQRIIMIMRY